MLETTTDMTRGVYRRVYSSGFFYGRRINAVSDAAELLFNRLLMFADDFGNCPADPAIINSHALARRGWNIRKVEKAIGELLGTGSEATPDSPARPALITKYAVGGESYLHITGFEDMQPAPKNGRRIQRHPHPPHTPLNGESGGIRISPGVSGKSQASDTQPDTHSETDTQPEAKAVRRNPGGSDSAAPGLGSGRVGSESVADALARIGVNAASIAVIADCPAVTMGEVRREWESIVRANGTVKSRPGLLVDRLCKAHGIKRAPPKPAASVGAQLAMARIHRLRENAGGGV